MSTPPNPNSNRSKKKRRRRDAWLRRQRQIHRKRRAEARKAKAVAFFKNVLTDFCDLLPNPNRGRDFEHWADGRLSILEKLFPGTVRIVRQEAIELTNGLRVVPDFRLEIQEPEGKQVRTIECQSRRRISNSIVQKLRDMRTHSKYNRFMLLYSNSGYLSRRVTEALDADGIVHYNPDGFVAFLARLAWKTYCLQAPQIDTSATDVLRKALVRCHRYGNKRGDKTGTALFAQILAKDMAPQEPIESILSRVDPSDIERIVGLLDDQPLRDEGMLASR